MTTKDKGIYKQKNVSLSCHIQKSRTGHGTYSEILFKYFYL